MGGKKPSGGADDLTLSIAMNGVVFATDTVHFYPFTSIVIVFEGEFGNPHDDPPLTGMSQLALEMYQRGYDVHAYDEPDIIDDENTEEMAVAEILSALFERNVTHIVLVGYSHGGGSVYDISERLSLETQPPILLAMTAYIDAISQPLLNTTAEIRRPISSNWHLNYYQSRAPWYAFDLHGGASVPAGAGFELDLDAAGESVSHMSIDSNPAVLMGVLNHLEERVER
ncbi:MAG: hypothetical protein ILO10_08690 [Kiritimatiellae bacterium]|nr:hypothetical protein [Kiritimatiellia bacterium]